MKVSTHDDKYEDDFPVFNIEDDMENKLCIHVGPVYYQESYPDGHPEKGIWIDNTDGNLMLISYETFKALNDYIDRKFLIEEVK